MYSKNRADADALNQSPFLSLWFQFSIPHVLVSSPFVVCSAVRMADEDNRSEMNGGPESLLGGADAVKIVFHLSKVCLCSLQRIQQSGCHGSGYSKGKTREANRKREGKDGEERWWAKRGPVGRIAHAIRPVPQVAMGYPGPPEFVRQSMVPALDFQGERPSVALPAANPWLFVPWHFPISCSRQWCQQSAHM